MTAIALLIAAGFQLAMPSAVALPEIKRKAPAPVSSLQPVRAVFNAYNSIMAHPIFAPDRAPPPAEAEAAGNLSGVEVLGTAIAGKSSAALVRDADGEFERLKVGGEVDGWKLVSISAAELTFDRNGERRSLEISATAPTRAGIKTTMGHASSSSDSSGDDSDDSDDDSDE
ncbi:MAG: hypothetical protein WDM89_07285 [Rhizomicrobium sp.]